MKKRKLFVLGLLVLITIVATIIGYNAESIQQLNNEEEIKGVVKSALNIYSKVCIHQSIQNHQVLKFLHSL